MDGRPGTVFSPPANFGEVRAQRGDRTGTLLALRPGMRIFKLSIIALLVGCGSPEPTDDTPNQQDPGTVGTPGTPGTPGDPGTPGTPATPGTPTPPPPGMNPAPLKDVSFAGQIVPMLDRRGCASCHSGNGIGRDLGNLTLDGGDAKVFREIVTESSDTYKAPRVDLKTPEASLILAVPSTKGMPQVHPVQSFVTPTDADYQLILVWIKEGAKQN